MYKILHKIMQLVHQNSILLLLHLQRNFKFSTTKKATVIYTDRFWYIIRENLMECNCIFREFTRVYKSDKRPSTCTRETNKNRTNLYIIRENFRKYTNISREYTRACKLVKIPSACTRKYNNYK